MQVSTDSSISTLICTSPVKSGNFVQPSSENDIDGRSHPIVKTPCIRRVVMDRGWHGTESWPGELWADSPAQETSPGSHHGRSRDHGGIAS